MPWFRGLVVFTAQIVGSIASAGVVSALFPGPMSVATSLGGGTSITRGLFIEMFLTAQLVFTIFMLAAEKHKGTFLAPVGIGLSLFIAELAGRLPHISCTFPILPQQLTKIGVYYTGGSLNPARSFGPAVVIGHFDGYHWLYWVGPFLGTLVAVVFYRLIKTLEYETANPGQDFDDREDEVFNPDEEPATAADVRRPNVSTGDPDFVRSESGAISPSVSRGFDTGGRPGSQAQQGPQQGGYNGGIAPVMSEKRRVSSDRRGRSSGDAQRPVSGADSHNRYPNERTYQVAPSAELGALPGRL
ncbi:MAG: aquaporin [Terriglobus roseus]|nr:aquaporin [Terriglobus roseus]